MKLRRLAALVGKEFLHGANRLIFIFALVIPVVVSLVISLLVGTLFSGKARLGVADLGASQLPGRFAALDYLTVREYDSAEVLKADVERGALDMGLVLPAGFDAGLQSQAGTDLDLYIWGESLLKNRTLLGVTLIREIIDLAGREIPVRTVTNLLGDEVNVPWDVRLFPFVVIITIILGGMMVPATSLVEEKQKGTLTALTITPVSLGEVLVAKGVAGVLISLFMGLVILGLNRAFGTQPGLLVLVVSLSAILAAAFGVILGSLLKDINTLFTAMKSMGIFLYAPAIVYLFPQIPEWVARLFPTYYMLGPIVELSLNNAGWAEIATDVYILCGLIVAAVAAAAWIANRAPAPRARAAASPASS